MKRVAFFFALCGLAISSLYGASCRPAYNYGQRWGGLPTTWGSYRRYNRCCLNQDFYVDIELGGYQLNSPGFAFGEILSPLTGAGIADIPEFFLNREHISSFYPRLTLGVEMMNCWNPCWVGNTIFFEIGGSYISNDKFSDLGNGIFTNFALPVLNGSGDFIAETGGVETEFSGVDFKRQYRYGNVAFKLGSCILTPRSPRFSIIPFVELDFSYLHQGYKLNIGSITGGAIATRFQLREFLNTKYYDFGIGSDFSFVFTPECRTAFLVSEAAIFCSSTHTHLKGRESAIFPLIGVPTQNFIERKHDAFTFKGRVKAGIGYQFGYNFAASIIGQVDYWGYIPQVINPHRIETTPSLTGLYDKPAHIIGKRTTNYAVYLNLNFVFF